MNTNPLTFGLRIHLFLGALLLLATTGAPSGAQTGALPIAEQEPDPAPAPSVPAEMLSPRAVLEAFVERMLADEKKSAAELLDLSQLSAIAAATHGPDLAYKLFRIVPAVGSPPRLPDSSRDPLWAPDTQELDFRRVPTDPDHPSPWPISDWLIAPTAEADKITLTRGDDGAWRASAEPVSEIDSLFEASEEEIDDRAEQSRSLVENGLATEVQEPSETLSLSLRRLFPQPLRKTYLLLPTYQWILLLALLPLGHAVQVTVRNSLTWLSDRIIARYDPEFATDHETTVSVWRPIGRLAAATSWVFGAAYAIDLPGHVTNVLLGVLVFLAAVAAVIACFRVIDLVAAYMARRAERQGKKFDDLVVPLLASTLKVVAVLSGVVVTTATFKTELPATLLGGLGIGGIAIALASQETLSNFIGSISLVFDRPFEVGDWIKVDTIEGEVESVGFRSTRIRTGPNSQVTLPNSKLGSANVDNLGARKYRRYLTKIGLEYGSTPEQIEAFCEGLRELIRRHPHTRKDFYAAYFNDFGPSALEVLLVVYFQVPDWATELRERHRLLADIVRLAGKVGVSFAFPTQTLHIHQAEAASPPVSPEEPVEFGARTAAEIAGELPNYQDRPGKVKFSGPTQFD